MKSCPMKTNVATTTNQKEINALAKFAKALSHPTRIAILKHLENQSCCFTGDLVDVFPIAQSTVSQHLKELKNAGLIQGELKPPKKNTVSIQKIGIRQKLYFSNFSSDPFFTNQIVYWR